MKKEEEINAGIYYQGKFCAYGSRQTKKDVQLEFHDLQAKQALNESNTPIHGVLIGKIFKPFDFNPRDKRGREDYLHTIQLKGETYHINYEGELFDKSGKLVGKLNEDMTILPAEEYKKKVKEGIDELVAQWQKQETPRDITKEQYSQLVAQEKLLLAAVLKKSNVIGLGDRDKSRYQESLTRYSAKSPNDIQKIIHSEKSETPKGLEGLMAAAIIGIIGGFFFLFYSSSGNIMLSPGQVAFNWRLFLGIVLFFMGVVSFIVLIKKRTYLK